jgi:hypothetical protein
MTYEKYEKNKYKFTEGQELLHNDKPCTFVEHDECYGQIWIKLPNSKKVNTNDMFAPTKDIDTISVDIETIEFAKKIKNKSAQF